METNALFNEVTRRCGLAAMLAPGTVRRALQQVGADPAIAGIDEYFSILSILMQRLSVYLGDDEAKDRIRQIRGFLKASRQVVAAEADAPPVAS